MIPLGRRVLQRNVKRRPLVLTERVERGVGDSSTDYLILSIVVRHHNSDKVDGVRVLIPHLTEDMERPITRGRSLMAHNFQTQRRRIGDHILNLQLIVINPRRWIRNDQIEWRNLACTDDVEHGVGSGNGNYLVCRVVKRAHYLDVTNTAARGVCQLTDDVLTSIGYYIGGIASDDEG